MTATTAPTRAATPRPGLHLDVGTPSVVAQPRGDGTYIEQVAVSVTNVGTQNAGDPDHPLVLYLREGNSAVPLTDGWVTARDETTGDPMTITYQPDGSATIGNLPPGHRMSVSYWYNMTGPAGTPAAATIIDPLSGNKPVASIKYQETTGVAVAPSARPPVQLARAVTPSAGRGNFSL